MNKVKISMKKAWNYWTGTKTGNKNENMNKVKISMKKKMRAEKKNMINASDWYWNEKAKDI